jgi:hypothetical protein
LPIPSSGFVHCLVFNLVGLLLSSPFFFFYYNLFCCVETCKIVIMAPRKDLALTNAIPAGTAPAPLPASKLPTAMRFPLLVILSLALTTLGNLFLSGSTGIELASLSRSLNEPWQAGAALGWRIVELAVGWFFGFDGKSNALRIEKSPVNPILVAVTDDS